MKEKDQESRQHPSHSQVVKKKCKKKRSPLEDESSRHRQHRRDDSEARRKDHRSRDSGDNTDSRRKERDYDNGESRRKEREDETSTADAVRRRRDREEDDLDQGRTRKCNRHRRKRDEPRIITIKEESDSDSDNYDSKQQSPHDRSRSRSPRNDNSREDRRMTNMESLVGNIKEEKHNWGRSKDDKEKKKPMENKANPDFGLSGKLTEETNIVNGVVIKYSEPEEARKPKVRWRFYPFKGDSSLPVMHLHRQSAYLIGRDRKIADLPVDHPSCSKQHAVLQYRLVPFTRPDGSQGKRVRPYIIDLESANGTFVNNKKVEPKKYVELLERDVIKFAFSSREYVLLHEHSKDAHLDDDVQ